MPKFIIERNIPGIGDKTVDAVKAISQKSCQILTDLGPAIQWIHCYVTKNKMYCVYRSPDAERIKEHAKRGGFPDDAISQVYTIIDPTTAE